MSEIKERIIGALSIMSDEDAENIWAFIKDGYVVKTKTWNDIDEVAPTDDELEILSKYESGHPDYEISVTDEELAKCLGL